MQKGSPAEVAGLLPFFDFIIEIGGKPMTPHQQARRWLRWQNFDKKDEIAELCRGVYSAFSVQYFY